MARAKPFRRVAIVGLGLMGGSLARALRRLTPPPSIAASSREPGVLDRARSERVIDVGTPDPTVAVQGADLVVYATPVGATLDLLSAHRELWGEGTVVTDLGSVKRPITARAGSLGLSRHFVGGHPIAGSHRSGFDASDPTLYDGARVWLVPLEAAAVEAPTPDSASDGETLDRLTAFWRALGAEPHTIGAERHDRMMAWLSHLPQLSASALGAALAGSGEAAALLGPGGMDAVRLAASPGRLWADILVHNADLLARPLAELRSTLDVLATALERRDGREIARIFGTARRWCEPSPAPQTGSTTREE